jgi:hypothetical protein
LEIKLTNVERLIARCWKHSEEIARELVATKYFAPAEEYLTSLFAGEFREAVASVSDAREVDKAFLADLRASIPRLDSTIAQRVSGLVARVTLHNHWHEGHLSGADLGLIIMRPVVRLQPGGVRIEFRRDNATGLLAQAKLGIREGSANGKRKWDGLTKPQERLYRKRRDYYSLLLYRLSGEKLSELGPLRWQLCKQYTVKRVKQWFKSDAFPDEIDSSDVLEKLFARSIGIGDSKVIKTIIDPATSNFRSIEIRIFWPDGAGPPPCFDLYQQEHQEQRIQIRH